MQRKLLNFASATAILIGLGTQPWVAFAQTGTAAALDAGDNAPADNSDIVVTGSLIQRDGYDQPTPVTTQTSEALLAAAPATIADALNQLPQFQNSGTRASCCSPGQGGNTLNLRNLGAERTLILLDGQRINPTSEQGTVDVNLLPELLIGRVDVVTGGASAAYGSDAVSGVVNYVIDDKFTGLKVNAQAGISNYGDDPSIKLGAAFGASFADNRGRFVVSFEHFKSDGFKTTDRGYYSRDGLATGEGTASSPYRFVRGARDNFSSNGGVIVDSVYGLPFSFLDPSNPLVGTVFDPGGAFRPYNVGTPLSDFPLYSIGGDGAAYTGASVLGSLETQKAFGKFSYDVTDNITASVSVNLAQSRTRGVQYADTRYAPQTITIFRDNAFLPAGIAAIMDSAGLTDFQLARNNVDLGLLTNAYFAQTYDFNAGLNGKLIGDFTWRAGFSQGETVNDGGVENNLILGNFYAAADAVLDGSGNRVCRVTLTNPGSFPGCVPINLFGSGSPSAAAIDYVTGESNQRVTNKQRIFYASVQGTLLTLPAGDLSVAAGAEYRTRSLVERSDPISTGRVQAAGVRGVPSAICPTATSCQFGGHVSGNFGEADASDNVKEIFGEAIVPVLRDTPFFNLLELNAAIRRTSYSNSGAVTTWKLGATWEPIEGVRLRGTRSRDIRAPNLYNLFAGPVIGFFPGVDDSATTGQTNVFILTSSQGNPNLVPEIGTTWTGGVVFQPSALSGFAASIDYYNIKFKGGLTSTDPQDIVDDCAMGDAAACALITRAAGTQTIVSVVIQPINATELRVSGVDFDVSYRRDLGFGTVGMRILANRSIEYQTTSGGLTENPLGYYNFRNNDVFPKWRGNAQLTLDTKNFSAFVQGRYVGSLIQRIEGEPDAVFEKAKIPAQFYVDTTLTFRTDDKRYEFYTTINNVLNKKPPFLPNSFAAGLGVPSDPTYDLEGRYFTVGARVKF